MCYGYKIEKAGVIFYLSKNDTGYELTEESTGYQVFKGSTIKDIEDQLKSRIEEIKGILTRAMFTDIRNRKNELVEEYNSKLTA